MKVLIVENDSVVRVLLEKHFRTLGFEVTACADGTTASAAYRQMFYPLIIVDLGLPDMLGVDLCRQIRAMPGGRRSIIWVFTERQDPKYLRSLLEAGADEYLIKPVSTKRLKLRLTRLERHRYDEHVRQADYLATLHWQPLQ